MNNFVDFDTEAFDAGRLPYMPNQNMGHIDAIKHLRFQTESECLLAIAIWLNTPKEYRDLNEFRQTFINTLRMIRAKTHWAL